MCRFLGEGVVRGVMGRWGRLSVVYGAAWFGEELTLYCAVTCRNRDGPGTPLMARDVSARHVLCRSTGALTDRHATYRP